MIPPLLIAINPLAIDPLTLIFSALSSEGLTCLSHLELIDIELADTKRTFLKTAPCLPLATLNPLENALQDLL